MTLIKPLLTLADNPPLNPFWFGALVCMAIAIRFVWIAQSAMRTGSIWTTGRNSREVTCDEHPREFQFELIMNWIAFGAFLIGSVWCYFKGFGWTLGE